MAVTVDDWAGVNAVLPKRVVADNLRNRSSYAELPERIASDFRSEQEVHQGDYRRRQVFELIQNGADAITGDGTLLGGRVHVLLTDSGLYCANEGEPFTAEGINSLRFQLWSSKIGNQIGRFGRGFKSVLALTDQPRILSRSGSFVFSRKRSRQFLLESSQITEAHLGGGDEVPILAIAEPIDPISAAADDSDLSALMEWATTVIHLPFTVGSRFTGFSSEDRFSLIENDLERFEPEFLIFAKHVQNLTLEIRGSRRSTNHFQSEIKQLESPSELSDIKIFDCLVKDGNNEPTRWTLLEPAPIAVPEAVDGLSINRRRDDRGKPLPVPMAWAIPESATQLGKFWSFFPTLDETSLRGILNAPWDTNTERTRLSDNSYNRFLVGCFADLVLSAIPLMKGRSTDLGAYLEFLPARGREERSEAAIWLAAAVNDKAAQTPTLPNLDGEMCLPGTLRRPPDGIPLLIQEAWAAAPGAPKDFVNPAVADPDKHIRLARMKLYMEAAGADTAVPVTEWLELLLIDGDPKSSMAALEIARALAGHSPLLHEKVKAASIVMLES